MAQGGALVTGASGNLGQAVCERLAREGYRIVRVEREQATLDGRALSPVDLGSAEATRTLVRRAAEELGGLDVVVHTVGTFRMSGPSATWQSEDLRFLLETNLVTTAHVLSAASAVMGAQQRGRIVVVGSTAALAGGAGVAAYAASKAAQLRLVESAAAELASSGVAVTAVLPATMDTPQNRAAMPDADRSTWVSLADVSEVIAFLCSPVAVTLSGQALRVGR